MESNKKSTTQRARLRHPEKYIARTMVSNALRDGILTRQPCTKCNAEKSEAHHEDYFKPLEVIWLCRTCHVEHHKAGKPKAIRKPSYKPRERKPVVKNALIPKAEELRKQGLSYSQIAEQLGMSKGMVFKWLNNVNYY